MVALAAVATGSGGGSGAGGAGNGAGGGGGATTCSGLQTNPTPGCTIAPPPNDGCTGFMLSPADFSLPANPSFGVPTGSTRLDGETSVVIDPRPGSKNAYAVTINGVVTPGTGPAGKCILQKSLTVYTWNDPQNRWDIIQAAAIDGGAGATEVTATAHSGG